MFATLLGLTSALFSNAALGAEKDAPSEPSPREEKRPRSTLTIGSGVQGFANEANIQFMRLGQRFQAGPTTFGWTLAPGFYSPQHGKMVCCSVAYGGDIAFPLLRTSALRLGPSVGWQALIIQDEGKSFDKGSIFGPSVGLHLGLFPRTVDSDLTLTTFSVSYVHWFGSKVASSGEPGVMMTLEAPLAFF